MAKRYEVVLKNDDHNSFQKVMSLLISIKRPTNKLELDDHLIAAEQIANIVHTKGECSVKIGDFDTIFDDYNFLKENGLNVEFQEYGNQVPC